MENKTKYKNQKIEYDGIKFDSKKEAHRYIVLRDHLRDGLIKDLKLQQKYILIPAQYEPDHLNKRGQLVKGKCIERECYYMADFQYIDCKTGQLVVEDVKGYKRGGAYALFTIKRKLMLKIFGIRVVEV